MTTVNFPAWIDGSSCDVSINPEWTGFLFVEFMDTYLGDFFHVDGERVPSGDGQNGVHGMAPRSTLILVTYFFLDTLEDLPGERASSMACNKREMLHRPGGVL